MSAKHRASALILSASVLAICIAPGPAAPLLGLMGPAVLAIRAAARA